MHRLFLKVCTVLASCILRGWWEHLTVIASADRCCVHRENVLHLLDVREEDVGLEWCFKLVSKLHVLDHKRIGATTAISCGFIGLLPCETF